MPRRYAALLAIALVVQLFAAARPAAAGAGDWELLPGYVDGAYQLWAHQSGAVFALGQAALYRSDDLGDTWQALGTPDHGRIVAVDPVNTHTLYARAIGDDNRELLQRSDDDGLTWRTLQSYTSTFPAPTAPLDGYPAQQFAISATQHDALYAYEGERLARSADGGATWQPLGAISHAGSPCVAEVGVLQVDPQNARRIFTDAGCYAGRDAGFVVTQSIDAGASFSIFFDHGVGSAGGGTSVGRVAGYPRYLAGSNGRWYVAVDPFLGAGPARLLRSDDDGANWTSIWDTGDVRAATGGIVIDANNPDLVYVALGTTADPGAASVRFSPDGGQTWSTVGSAAIGQVHDLARTRDGTALFAATNEGVWRYLTSK